MKTEIERQCWEGRQQNRERKLDRHIKRMQVISVDEEGWVVSYAGILQPTVHFKNIYGNEELLFHRNKKKSL